ncbi:hypothetical protein [Mesorhizobium sp. B1-1-8]|uniref:hypothetical protein n=1 Tax=Mesorhizobium sp. B1-1-8 TaxID=2589976 RepID=UPI00112C6EAC|nr:hypothetical protein [Mesorhizobium sp. B1-1-8]UCI06247.1 hypothetical protein FJ974_20855 [Mesorhizobium sp. B1-1-8]
MIDFSTKLLDVDGTPIVENGVDATLGRAAANALLAPFADEQNLPGEEKVKRFELAMRVCSAKELTLPVEEVALIKKLVAKAFPVLIVGRCWAILDPSNG